LRRRLGGELVEELIRVLKNAQEKDAWRDIASLEPFIGPLLREYYDPLYLGATQRLERDVAIRGSREELGSWIRHQRL
jgi:hypothetical protein